MTNEPGLVDPGDAVRPLVLALDVGSSSIRAALHDRTGRPLADQTGRVGYAWEMGTDGSVRLGHRALLDLVGEALDEVAARAGSLAADVVAGGISCFFHSIVGLDDRDRPVTPVLSWADTTSAAQATSLRSQVDAGEVHAISGAPIHASYWPARILRLRTEEPGASRWAGFPEILAESLTGRRVVSRSMASGTGVLDRARGVWSERLLAELRLDTSQLPPIVDDDVPIGLMSRAAAQRWPSFARIPWFAAWGDGACGNVGLGAADGATMALMIGTSGAIRGFVAEPAPAIPAGLFAYRLGGGALVGAQLSEGGGLLAWASRLLGRSPAALERAAAAVQPAGHGLTVLPYTFGERGLGYHDDAQGTLLGMAPATGAGAVYRAILESIAFNFAAADELLAEVMHGPAPIVVSGGAVAHSPLLAQIVADALGRDVRVAPALEASRRGAALLTLCASGFIDDVARIAPPRSRTVRFDPRRSERYALARARQGQVYRTILGGAGERHPAATPAPA